MTAATGERRAVEASSGAARRGAAPRWIVFGGIALAVAVADQVSKAWIDASFALATTGPPVAGFVAPTPLIGEFVRIAKGYNDGGIFGLFGDSAPVLGVASLAVICLIVLYHARAAAPGGLPLSLALGLLLGGAVGNFLDRFQHGHVIDFADMGIGSLRWYTFNVADAAISIAIVLLIGVSLIGERQSRQQVSATRGEP